MTYKNGDTLHIKVRVVGDQHIDNNIRVRYPPQTGIAFYVALGDVIKHEPRPVTPGDKVRHKSGLNLDSHLLVECVSEDGKWAWLKIIPRDISLNPEGYLTYQVDSLIRIDE